MAQEGRPEQPLGLSSDEGLLTCSALPEAIVDAGEASDRANIIAWLRGDRRYAASSEDAMSLPSWRAK